MRENDIKIKPKQILRIENVLYLGDEGGIGCEVKWSKNQTSAVITSLTQVKVQSKHPLAADIRAYKTERQKRLAQIRGSNAKNNCC